MRKFNDLRDQLKNNVQNQVLPFWMNHAIDDQNGGFIGAMRVDGSIEPQADKHLVLNARILWTFAAAYRLFRDEAYLAIARRAFEYILEYFWDDKTGGGIWALKADGSVRHAIKVTYAQGFLLYGFSELARATEDVVAHDYARRAFDFLQAYCRKDDHYLETASFDEQNESVTGTIAAKGQLSMNTHLHILEPMTNFYRIEKTEQVEEALASLIRLTAETIYNPKTSHLHMFFDQAMKPVSRDISFGHDIEASWLLHEAAQVWQENASDSDQAAKWLARCRTIAVDMSRKVLMEGVDPNGGGLFDLGSAKGMILGRQKVWWAQAEGIVGAINAWQLTGEDFFLDQAIALWQYTAKHVVDAKSGAWLAAGRDSIAEANSPYLINGWKCPYHNSRCAFEIWERARQLSSS